MQGYLEAVVAILFQDGCNMSSGIPAWGMKGRIRQVSTQDFLLGQQTGERSQCPLVRE